MDGHAVAFGDIQLSEIPATAATAKDSKRPESLYYGAGGRWPNGVIPYAIDPALPNPSRIASAIARWESATFIRLVARTNEANSIRFVRGTSSCSSNVGMIGGEQSIVLADGCDAETVAHEIGHAIGLWHEHQRVDRHRYLHFDFAALDREYFTGDFYNTIDDRIDGPYDYGSIMHYRLRGSSYTGRPEVSTIPPGIPISEVARPSLSATVVNTVKKMYGIPVPETVIDTNPAGLNIVVDGVTYAAPRGFDWAEGSTHTIELPDAQVRGGARFRFARWSDEGERSHSVTIARRGEVLLANAFAEAKILVLPADPGSGTVSFTPPAADQYFRLGQPLRLTANPPAGQQFQGFDSSFVWNALTGLGPSLSPIAFFNQWPLNEGFFVQPLFRPAGQTISTIETNWPFASVGLDGGVGWNGPARPPFWDPGTAHSIAGIDGLTTDGRTRFLFEGWADGDTNRTKTIVNNGGAHTAIFKRQFKVSMNPGFFGGTGSFAPGAGDGFVDDGTLVQFSATPAQGSVFLGWGGDVHSASNPLFVKVDRPLLVEPIFGNPNGIALPVAMALRTRQGLAVTKQMTLHGQGAYQAVAAEPWVSISPASGTLPATVTITADPGSFAPGRYNAPIQVASRTMMVDLTVEPAQGCSFSVSPDGAQIGNGGGGVFVQVTSSNPYCYWTAKSDFDASFTPSAPEGWGSATLVVSTRANRGLTRSARVTIAGVAVNITQAAAAAPQATSLTLTAFGSGTIDGAPTGLIALGTVITVTANPGPGWRFVQWGGACGGTAPICQVTMNGSLSVEARFASAEAQARLHFIPVTPCRSVDTRLPVPGQGAPALVAGAVRDFALPQGGCNIPPDAVAYSLNVTVIPRDGTLGYITLWPAGGVRPEISTLNSVDGRVKANAAIVPAGVGGAISVFVTDSAELILDINGYFVLAGSRVEGRSFYSLTNPCRMVDTRLGDGPLGGPALTPLQQRAFPVRTACGLPAGAEAYSLNATVVPPAPLSFLTLWPDGSAQPVVSTLNAPRGGIVANAAILRAGTNGAIDALATERTHLLLDVSGYFAAPGAANALSFYATTPCRAIDTRTEPAGAAAAGATAIRWFYGVCGIPSTARAVSVNVTVIPRAGTLGYFTMWPAGFGQPAVSTLNAIDGSITSNAAIVPLNSTGFLSYFATDRTDVLIDVNGYFAP